MGIRIYPFLLIKIIVFDLSTVILTHHGYIDHMKVKYRALRISTKKITRNRKMSRDVSTSNTIVVIPSERTFNNVIHSSKGYKPNTVKDLRRVKGKSKFSNNDIKFLNHSRKRGSCKTFN